VRLFIVLNTILGFTIHVVMGCCAHHDHGPKIVAVASTGDDSIKTTSHSRCRGHAGHRHAHAQPSATSDQQPTSGAPMLNGLPERHECPGTTCHYTLGDRPGMDRGDLEWTALPLGLASLVEVPLVTVHGSVGGNIEASPSSTLPLRAHLFFGVLLI
jgi:hypothetical protein